MTSHHQVHLPTEVESTTTDSVTSSPRSDHRSINDESNYRVRLMCSFGGKILPRPHDNQLRYVGGDTRIVAVHRHTSFSSLLSRLSKVTGAANVTVKYQLPNEDLDALITVTCDEDVENMMEEYDRFAQINNVHSNASRLRLFLFSNDAVSRTSSISSLLDGSTKREHWFLDALNGGSSLERGRSEVSSIVSEVPDYLFGLDNSDDQNREPKPRTRSILAETISNSDPGSPAPVVSSPFCSTSSSLAPPCVTPIPELPPVKTKPENPVPVTEPKEAQYETFMETSEPLIMQQPGYGGNPTWHYVPNVHYPGQALKQGQVYYVRGPPGNVPVQPIQMQAQYIQPFPNPSGRVPVGFHQHVPGMGMGQPFGGGVRHMAPVDSYDTSARAVPDGLNQQMYYGTRNAYPGMVVPGGEEMQVNGPEAMVGRVPPS